MWFDTIRFDDWSSTVRLLLLLVWKSYCEQQTYAGQAAIGARQVKPEKGTMSMNAHFTATRTLKRVQLLTCQPSLCLSNAVPDCWDLNYWFALSLAVESRPGKMDWLEYGQRQDLAPRGSLRSLIGPSITARVA